MSVDIYCALCYHQIEAYRDCYREDCSMSGLSINYRFIQTYVGPGAAEHYERITNEVRESVIDNGWTFGNAVASLNRDDFNIWNLNQELIIRSYAFNGFVIDERAETVIHQLRRLCGDE